MRPFIISILILLSFSVSAQEIQKDTIINDMIVIRGDSLTIPLDEIMILNKLNFKTTKEKRYYYWYWKKVNKAYPYAKLAADRLIELNEDLAKMRSKRKRKKHTRKMQK